MNDPVLAYLLFMATNVVIASLTAFAYFVSVLPIIAYAIGGVAVVSLVLSAVLFTFLFVTRKPEDTTSEQENSDQVAYLDEWRRLKNNPPKKVVDAISSNQYK